MIVTIDFDGTLSRNDVQEYAKELIDRGIEVWIVTSRFDDLHKHLYPVNPNNEEVFEIADKVGIPHRRIIFTNMLNKGDFLDNTHVVCHLDDDSEEINYMNVFSRTLGKTNVVDVNKKNWRQQFEKTLIKNS